MEMTLDEFVAAIVKSDEDAKAKAVRELTGEESRVFHTSYRPRPGWMPEDCRDTPTRYLCVCFGNDARDAVESATADVQWTTALRDIRCDGFHALGATVGQLIGRMLDELDFQSGSETYSAKVNCTDLLFEFDDFMRSASKYLMLRHGNDQNVRDAICAVAGCINFTEEHLQSIQAVRLTAALNVTTAEFRQRVTELLVLDAQGGDAQGVDFAKDLDPERNQKDAITYCARVVLYAWTHLGKSKRTASDYVFCEAKSGDRIFSACKCARTYQQSYNFKPSSVETQAGKLHAELNNYHHHDGVERPESMRLAAIKSRREEEKSLKGKKPKHTTTKRK